MYRGSRQLPEHSYGRATFPEGEGEGEGERPVFVMKGTTSPITSRVAAIKYLLRDEKNIAIDIRKIKTNPLRT